MKYLDTSTLGVLMWKHSMVRMRRFVHSTFEFISPAILFVLMFSVWRLVNHSNEQRENPEIILPEQSIIQASTLTNIFFKPETPKTVELIESAANQLGIRNNLNNMLPNREDSGYLSYSNESDFIKYMNMNGPTAAGVIFQGMEGGEWPKKLNYTIRMKSNFRTQSTKYMTYGFHEAHGEEYYNFVALQWAIDKAYVELLSGRPVEQKLSVQHFPMPRSVQEDHTADILQAIMTLFTLLSPLTFFLFLVSRLVLERNSGVKELMKMVGVSVGALNLSHILNSAVTCAVYVGSGVLVCKVTSTPIIPHTNGLFIALTLFLYFLYIIALAFFCSTILNTSNQAISLSFALFGMSSGLGCFVFSHVINTSRLFLLTGLVPHVPVIWFWYEVGALLKYGGGSTFSNMFEVHTTTTANVAYAWLFLLLQTVLLFLFSWYLDCVRPGNYGMAKPWNFIFKMGFCVREKVNPDKDELEPVHKGNKQYFESAPSNLDVGIKVANVSKIFGTWSGPKNKALSNVTLEIYKGEITVLLGHNGAGKTTLMSIITGMFSATSGTVFIKGLEISENLQEIRKSIGLCPQHNLTFDDLTVREHVIFFAMLKGATYSTASANCEELLNKLKISDKATNMSGQLSGGMKRRLQLACALAGGADVLILDEPTSGLDVETRRELWNLILSLRGSRTVLLTTHFMEEADALGDRVAALHGGVLRCHATPMYLKKAIGTGYRLTLTLGRYNKENLTAAVTSILPGSQLNEATPLGATFSLPAKDCPLFPKLFNSLEERKNELGIKSMGVGVTTLEEVFLRLCSDEHGDMSESTENGQQNGTSDHSTGDVVKYKKLQGKEFYTQQIVALLKRQYKYIMSKLHTFLILEVMLPVAIILFISYNNNNSATDYEAEMNPPRAMNPDLYAGFGKSDIFFNLDGLDGSIIDPLKKAFNDFEFINTKNVIEAILHEGNKSMSLFSQLLIGLELNATNANALYSTTALHTMPVSVNLLSNLLAKLYLTWPNDPRTITTVNHPVHEERIHSILDGFVEPKSTFDSAAWAIIVTTTAVIFMIPMASIAVLERVSGSRHIRIMSGCPAGVYWASTWMFHMFLVLVVVVPTLLIGAGLLDFESTFNNAHFLATLTLLTLLHAAAFLTFIYLVSYFTSEGGATSLLTIVAIVFCCIMPPIRTLTKDISSVWTIITGASTIFPPYNYAYGIIRIVQAARLNALCHLNKEPFCPETILHVTLAEPDFPQDCCTSNSYFGPLSYLDFSETGSGIQVILLIANFIVYGGLVLLMQYGVLNRLWDKIMNYRYNDPEPFYRDAMANAEKEYVNQKIAVCNTRGVVGEDSALVHDLHKNYRPVCRKACNSVQGVSFSVKQGECFGLLGVNGAGKSTIFKMLTGEEAITRGKINCNGYDIQKQRNAYLSTLTYCPQFGGLDNFLSGWDNVELMVKLRGVPQEHSHEEVGSWIDYVDLTDMKDRAVGEYSGGCQRRCSTAAALAGLTGTEGKHSALLDEPTAGVDPGARRRVWRALRRSLATGLSVIITSHSMDETEALCGRIAILSRGQIGALGSAAALRSAHATGYSAQLKLRSGSVRPSSDQLDGQFAVPLQNTDFVSTAEANRLKKYIKETFNSELKDEHKTMLHYHINDNIRYSELFTKMEDIKSQFPDIIEDYTISETTLEEVFLSFAKDADTMQPSQRV